MKSKTYKRKVRKRKSRGGHPTRWKNLTNEPLSITCDTDTCVPYSLFKLGYLTKEVAEYLGDWASSLEGITVPVIQILLKKKYEETYYYPGNTDENIKEHLKSGYCTLAFVDHTPTHGGHAIVICNIAGHIVVLDPANSTKKIYINDFFEQHPEYPRESLRYGTEDVYSEDNGYVITKHDVDEAIAEYHAQT